MTDKQIKAEVAYYVAEFDCDEAEAAEIVADMHGLTFVTVTDALRSVQS
jgi:hypothetical protein